jgi:uncharacterized membrane protein
VMQVLSEAVGFLKRPNLEKAKPYVQNSTFGKILGWIKLLLLIIMAAFYMFAGYMHFAKPDFYTILMPRWIPAHLELVYLSGVAEIACGAGLLIPQTRKMSAWATIAMLLALLPANFYIAIHNVPVFGATEGAGWKLWFRILLQWVLIAWAKWYTY